MCTSIIAGKNTTSDGSVILATNNDWPGYAGNLKYVPRKGHSSRDMFTLVCDQEIPQVMATYAYIHTTTDYRTGTRTASWIEGMNENQVAVSMSGVYAFKQIKGKKGLIEADDLPWLILERAKTAREGIEAVGKLIDEYGFTASSVDGAEGTVAIAIADPTEGWWLELVPGGEWIAKRVPDDKVSVRPNCFGIHHVNLKDEANVIHSKTIVESAVKHGWYDQESGDPFDFAQVYGAHSGLNEYGAELDEVNVRRRWRVMSLFSAGPLPEDELTYEIVPSSKLTLSNIMSALRDVLEGTKYDLTKVAEAEPFCNPFHNKPNSYSVAQIGTVVSFVAQLRGWLPNEIGGVLWVAFSNPYTSVYTPWYAGIMEVPQAYSAGETSNYSENSAWWAFKELSNLCLRRFFDAVRDVVPVWQDHEQKGFALINSIDNAALELYRKDRSLVNYFLTLYCKNTAENVMKDAINMGNKLRSKYLDHTVIKGLS